MDRNLLENGHNVEVTSTEGKFPTFRVKYALASRVMAYRLNQLDFSELKKVGFKRMVLSDSYEENWTWDLAK